MLLREFRALSFDCYGTLIDWERGLAAALAPLLAATDGRVTVAQALAAFGLAEMRQQAQTPATPYPEVLALVYARLATQWGVAADVAACQAFGESIGSWAAFADTAEALWYLRAHYRLFVLSNVDRASFARSQARLGVEFDGVFTAQDIGSYKPSLRNFEFLMARLGEAGIGRGDVLHVAQSLTHDHAPANVLGLASAWIDRRAGAGGGATPTPAHDVRYDFRFVSLAALVAAHRAEAR